MEESMKDRMIYKEYSIIPISILLASGMYNIIVHINYDKGRSVATYTMPTFEETFATEDEALDFGFFEARKLIDSEQLPPPA